MPSFEEFSTNSQPNKKSSTLSTVLNAIPLVSTKAARRDFRSHIFDELGVSIDAQATFILCHSEERATQNVASSCITWSTQIQQHANEPPVSVQFYTLKRIVRCEWHLGFSFAVRKNISNEDFRSLRIFWKTRKYVRNSLTFWCSFWIVKFIIVLFEL